MVNKKRFCADYLPVLLWMAFLFVCSTNLLSSAHTSRLLGTLLRWFKPDLSPTTLYWADRLLRKISHLTVYATLSILLWRAIRKRRGDLQPAWRWGEVLGAQALAVLYAASDEYHQSFHPSRQASVGDVLIDTAGALLGLGLVWAWGRRRKLW